LLTYSSRTSAWLAVRRRVREAHIELVEKMHTDSECPVGVTRHFSAPSGTGTHWLANPSRPISTGSFYDLNVRCSSDLSATGPPNQTNPWPLDSWRGPWILLQPFNLIDFLHPPHQPSDLQQRLSNCRYSPATGHAAHHTSFSCSLTIPDVLLIPPPSTEYVQQVASHSMPWCV
jgi:hypothetical protein